MTTRPRPAMSVLGIGLTAALVAQANAQSKTIFSVDPGLLSPGLDCGLIYESGPTAVAGGTASGLAPGDCIDAFSLRKQSPKFLLCFSVDRQSTGDPAKLPVTPLSSFNVTEQVGKRQAAGDAFISTEAYDRFTGKEPVPVSLGLENNILVINQSPVFSATFGVMPTISPDLVYRPLDPAIVVAADLDDINGGGTLPSAADLSAGLFFTLEGKTEDNRFLRPNTVPRRPRWRRIDLRHDRPARADRGR